MGLMDTLQKIIDLCISIQESLSTLIDMMGHVNGFHKSLVELSAIDTLALEKNVTLLKQYAEEIDYIISKLSELSGNIRLLFWLILSAALLVLLMVLYIAGKTIYENRQKFIELFERKSKDERKTFD